MAEEKLYEHANLEFKQEFQGTSREWIEIIKDIVAIANSGGGRLILGMNDDGEPSDGTVVQIDPATFTDKINRYCGVQFSKFVINSRLVAGKYITIIEIGESFCPLVFISPGTYEICSITHKQTTAFSKGTVYFRHGAKSEPGTSADLQQWAEKIANNAILTIKENLRQVAELPPGQKVTVVPLTQHSDDGQKVRLSNEIDATPARLIDPYSTHPYRQMDLIAQFNSRMKDKTRISSHDILCIRKVYQIEKKPEFFYKPPIKSAAPVYSDLFLFWLIDKFNTDSLFFDSTRKKAFPNSAKAQAGKDSVHSPPGLSSTVNEAAEDARPRTAILQNTP